MLHQLREARRRTDAASAVVESWEAELAATSSEWPFATTGEIGLEHARQRCAEEMENLERNECTLNELTGERHQVRSDRVNSRRLSDEEIAWLPGILLDLGGLPPPRNAPAVRALGLPLLRTPQEVGAQPPANTSSASTAASGPPAQVPVLPRLNNAQAINAFLSNCPERDPAPCKWHKPCSDRVTGLVCWGYSAPALPLSPCV